MMIKDNECDLIVLETKVRNYFVLSDLVIQSQIRGATYAEIIWW